MSNTTVRRPLCSGACTAAQTHHTSGNKAVMPTRLSTPRRATLCQNACHYKRHMHSKENTGSDNMPGYEKLHIPGVAEGVALQEQRAQHPPPP